MGVFTYSYDTRNCCMNYCELWWDLLFDNDITVLFSCRPGGSTHLKS